MNVNTNRIGSQSQMEEAPGTPPTGSVHSPSEVLAILKPSSAEPRSPVTGGLWKTAPQGSDS